jgi:hypothetical protein
MNPIRNYEITAPITKGRIVSYTLVERQVEKANTTVKPICGVTDQDSTNNGRVDVIKSGPALIEFGGPVDAGDILVADAEGRAIEFNKVPLSEDATCWILGVAEESGVLGPYLICPQNETTDKIEVDFFIPGMGRINDDGTISTIDVYVNIMYRVLGTIDWTIQTVKFSRRSMDEYGQTVIISVAKATYEVAIIRTTAAFDDIQVKDKVVCKRVKSRLNTVIRYSGITTMAMSIIGNNALADSAESRILCKPTRILPRLSNNNWIEPGPTNAIADFFGYAVKDAGHSDSTLSLPDLQTFKNKCTAQNQSFNAVFDNDSTLLDVLQRILYTGYAGNPPSN